ncbi:MAG TPA: isopentenyl-diphosphate Delta-isomerase [Cryptosporangiaceae bacterium]|nr:isopentenyl-diphosphate Delta-isomerase [Cryptosporangiaceae bacterium]
MGRTTTASPDAGAELIVLVDMHGEPIGTAPKLASHHRDTPLHLAFSAYAFDAGGRLLVTRRARSKKTWPGMWTNSCCGHPSPGESVEDAVRRRLREELGLTCGEILPLLPDFRYCAELDGVVENEVCPVFGLRVEAEPALNPAEVDDYRWMDWDDFVRGDIPGGLSPWAQLQVAELVSHPTIVRLRTPLA